MAGKWVFRIGLGLDGIDREIVANVDAAVEAAGRGDSIEARRTISFENWATFFRAMSPNRIAILEHVAAHGKVASTRAFSRVGAALFRRACRCCGTVETWIPGARRRRAALRPRTGYRRTGSRLIDLRNIGDKSFLVLFFKKELLSCFIGVG